MQALSRLCAFYKHPDVVQTQGIRLRSVRKIRKDRAGYGGGWQKSHYHTTINELYLVQKGTILFVELINDKTNVTKYSEGEFCVVHPMIPHNVYMFPNTITHTIKFGNCLNADWNECKELDEIITKIDTKSI